MSKKSAAHLKKFDEAVGVLNTTTGVNVPMAMILAGFPKKETTNETVRRMIRRRLKALRAKKTTPRWDAPAAAVRIVTNDTDLSPLTTGEDDDPSSTTTTSHTTTTGPMHPKPKRKQIRPTATAIQQRRANEVAAKRHKSDAHKAAVRLFNSEKQKPEGMSIRQVHEHITAKYKTCPSIATISRYASKEELVNASPMKMGPAGHISAMAYKFFAGLTRASCQSTR